MQRVILLRRGHGHKHSLDGRGPANAILKVPHLFAWQRCLEQKRGLNHRQIISEFKWPWAPQASEDAI